MFDDDTASQAASEIDPGAVLMALLIVFGGLGVLVWIFA